MMAPISLLAIWSPASRPCSWCRRHAELGEGPVQAGGDGSRGQAQALSDLAVGQALGGQPDDLALLRRERLRPGRAGQRPRDRDSAGPEFPFGAALLRPGLQCPEYLERRAQDWLGLVDAASLYDAPGASRGPDLYIRKERFRETFCADVLADLAGVMYATQRPLSLAAFTEKATAASWRDRPSWFLVSEDDNAISPDAERFMAERMNAVTNRSAARMQRSSPSRFAPPDSS